MNTTLMNSRLLLTAAALCALCSPVLRAQTVISPAPAVPATPPSASTAPAVTLRYKFAVGQVHRYEYDSAMNTMIDTGQTGAGTPVMNMTMQMVMRQTVKSIRPADGAATISAQIESLHLLRNGQEIQIPDAQAAKLKQPFAEVTLPNGKILSMDFPALDGAGGPGMDFGKVLFSSFAYAGSLPDSPVKIGDIWNGVSASTPGAASTGINFASTSALISLDQKNGATVATIRSKQSGTLNPPPTAGVGMGMKINGQVAGESAQLFDASAGTLQGAQGTSTINMRMMFATAGAAAPPGMPQAMKTQTQTKFQMQRLSDTMPAQ